MPTTSGVTSSGVKTIRQSVVIEAPPSRVYEALVTAKILAAFTGSPATGSRRVGAPFSVWGGYIAGVHRELVPNERIVQDWSTTEWPEGAPVSRLELTLRSVPKGTELRMVHSNVPASQADSYRQGWIDHYWEPLKAYFAAHPAKKAATVRAGSRATSGRPRR